jgi:hypothetical protein
MFDVYGKKKMRERKKGTIEKKKKGRFLCVKKKSGE